jgi:uncharacterized membrane protein YphA (DoxX/SURF4 family)
MGLFRLPGRIVYSIAIGCFGAHYILFAAGISPSPAPPWYPYQDKVSWIAGVCLFLAGISMLANWFGKWTAMALGTALLFRVAYIHIQRIVVNAHDPTPWISAGEILSLCGGAFALAGSLSGHRFFSAPISRPGQFLFALPLLVFGAQDLRLAQIVAALFPAWFPAPLNWVYGIGVFFILAALAIIFGRLATIASWLLGFIFLIWLVIVQAPRVVASPHSGSAWTSAIVALALAGSAWSVAGSISK